MTILFAVIAIFGKVQLLFGNQPYHQHCSVSVTFLFGVIIIMQFAPPPPPPPPISLGVSEKSNVVALPRLGRLLGGVVIGCKRKSLFSSAERECQLSLAISKETQIAMPREIITVGVMTVGIQTIWEEAELCFFWFYVLLFIVVWFF